MTDTIGRRINDDNETEEQRRIRMRQEEMERLLLDDETQDHENQHHWQDNDPGGDVNLMQQEQHPLNANENHNDNNNNVNDDAIHEAAQAPVGVGGGGGLRNKFSYTQSSFLAAAAAIIYALRSRGQWYLALVYLSSSKWAYCVLGNALVALAVQVFSYAINLFLQGGLRLHEAEGLQDFFRWNVTETCLALTMFRSELSVGTACEFVCLILFKCLHHVAVMRQNHLRMTDDAVTPSSWNPNFPSIPGHHIRVFLFLVLLQMMDLWALQYTAQILMTTGPSVSILFAFEAAILLVSAWSHLLLWNLHVLDGFLHFAHDLGSSWSRVGLHIWKEHKATLTFAVELQAQAVQFLFYLCFFGFVLTYYGVPINLFREVYVSFAALKERLLAFFKYRRLMAGMTKFANPTEEQLEEAGRVCIICRDEMTTHDSKQLPICKHTFHKSCLREWLTQQQTCPTCRSDIAAMQAQEVTRNAAAAAAGERQEEQEETLVAAGEVATDARDPSEEERHQQGPSASLSESAQEEAGKTDDGASSDRSSVVESEGNSVRAQASTDPAPPSTLGNRSNEVKIDGLFEGANALNAEESPCSDLPSTWDFQKKSKAVRFVDNMAALSDSGQKGPGACSSFPALYRVVRASGATVWQFDEGKGADTVVRNIPLGVVLLGEREEVKHFQELNGRKTVFVRVPDGWVVEDEIFRVYSFRS